MPKDYKLPDVVRLKKPTTKLIVSWQVDRVAIEGDPDCQHEFQTTDERQKSSDDEKDLNPRGERIIQVECSKCERHETRSETITEVPIQ